MEKKEQKFDFGLFTRVLALAKPHKLVFYSALFLAIIMAPLGTIRPWLISKMVDDHIFKSDIPGLQKMAMIYIALVIVTVLIRYVFIYVAALLGQSVIKDLRVMVFQHVNNLKLRYFDQTPIGSITTRTINDVEAINNVFSQGVITLVADVLAILSVIAVMFYTSWRLTLISLATLPLLIIASYIFKEKVRKAYQKVRTQISEMNAFLQERITGMRVVQIFNAEQQEMEKFKKINRAYTQANIDSILYYAVFFPVVELISSLTLALLVWYGTKGIWDANITIGAFIAFPMFLNMLFRPVRLLADKFNTLQMGLVAAERIFKVLDNKNVFSNEGSFAPANLKGDVSFKNVAFAYDEKNYVIHDLSFDIEAGETLAIVGSTGSGKSTIINILNRFYEIQSGQILVDGTDIKSFKLESLRKHIAIVLQDVFLFNGSVLENIRLRDPSISREKVIEASEMIGADDFLSSLPNGYDFKVTERGSNLSMGQRQLISFVRALVFDPDILILDEATSSIDKETESIIQFAIEKLIDKRTSIIIAHRLSTIQHADKIMVLEKGELVELGVHSELILKENGKYKKLYEMQLSAEVH